MSTTLIYGGECFLPETGRFARADVLVDGGTVAAVGAGLNADADFHVNAGGCVITPGLIDGHLHLFPLIRTGVCAEAFSFPSGVTSAADAGSLGCHTFPQMTGFLENLRITAKCWLNVSATGLASLPAAENVDPAKFDRPGIREMAERYPDRIVGLKVRTSKEVVGELGYGPVRGAVELGEELNLPVMVHCTNPPGPMNELLDMLRPGDVLTHMYQNTGHTILGPEGSVSKAAWAARERGVLFEAADARIHFSFRVGCAGVREGFYPDFISTDGMGANAFLRPTAFSMAMQLNKYISMGMPEEKALLACTLNPARLLGLYPRRGVLAAGSAADLAVFRRVSVPAVFGDRPEPNKEKTELKGRIALQPVMTMKDGLFVYRDITF